jgi:pyridoxamine 5'-phosphate oxidase
MVSAVADDELARLRQEYAGEGLDEAQLDPDPIAQFTAWMSDAIAAGLHEPNAMLLATASPAAAPSARLVLLKGVDRDGFRFFTNYRSRKAEELAANPRCALVFPWHPLQRQVRVEGRAQRLSGADSAAYFASRPRGAQLGAWASPQSAPVPDRAFLESRYAQASERWSDDAGVPLPPHWGGYRVAPESVEFWQGRASRMHDRLRYRRTPSGWAVDRLAP